MLEGSLVGKFLKRVESLPEAFSRHVFEVAIERETVRDIKIGQVVFVVGEFDIAALGDRDCVREGRWPIPEDRAHLLTGFQVELVAVIAQTVFVTDVLASPDTE